MDVGIIFNRLLWNFYTKKLIKSAVCYWQKKGNFFRHVAYDTIRYGGLYLRAPKSGRIASLICCTCYMYFVHLGYSVYRTSGVAECLLVSSKVLEYILWHKTSVCLLMNEAIGHVVRRHDVIPPRRIVTRKSVSVRNLVSSSWLHIHVKICVFIWAVNNVKIISWIIWLRDV